MNETIPQWFPYEALAGAGDPTLRPIVQVVVESPRRRLAAMAPFDSGADRSILPVGLARRLGVMPRRATTEIGVIGARVPAGRASLDIQIPLRSGRGRIEAVEFLVPLPEVELEHVVLGRDPTFKHFEVRFRDWQSRFAVVERSRFAVGRAPMARRPARGGAERRKQVS